MEERYLETDKNSTINASISRSDDEIGKASKTAMLYDFFTVTSIKAYSKKNTTVKAFLQFALFFKDLFNKTEKKKNIPSLIYLRWSLLILA